MKKRRGILELCLILTAITCFHTLRLLHGGSVVGRIYPAKTSPSVIAVRGDDSVKAFSRNGNFRMELQPGDWRLIFAVNEYNGTPVEKKVQVLEGQRINLGEIRVTR